MNFLGYFMYLEADARWDSEVMGFDIRLELHCRHSFDFSYYMYGENVQHIKMEAFSTTALVNYLIVFRDGGVYKIPFIAVFEWF